MTVPFNHREHVLSLAIDVCLAERIVAQDVSKLALNVRIRAAGLGAKDELGEFGHEQTTIVAVRLDRHLMNK